MAEAEKPNVAKYRDRMDRAVVALKEEFGSLRTGRASVSLLDQVVVEAYGSKMPINQVGAISVPEPRSITVSVAVAQRCTRPTQCSTREWPNRRSRCCTSWRV